MTPRQASSPAISASVMREIAQRHGGSLDARSEGGRFELVVCFPLGEPKAD